MQKRALFVCVGAVCAIFLLLTCSKSSGPTGPGGGGGMHVQVTNYVRSGNDIITSELSSSCYGTTLVTRTIVDTVPIVLSGNTLKAGVYSLDGNFSDPMAVVVIYYVFSRIGTGSDITGQWNLTGYDYELTAGTLTQIERNELDAQKAEMNASVGQMQVDIGASTITRTYCDADDYMESEAPYLTMLYNISAAKLSCGSVQLTGNISHEVVTLTWDSDGNVTYSSSNSQHASKVVYENPSSGQCPNVPPDWYNQFLTANSR
jgi:hypothetical protein